MRVTFCIIILCLTGYSCSTSTDANEEPTKQITSPQTIKFNDTKLTINTLTNDSIQAVINFYGDTIRTGESFLIAPNQVALDTLKAPVTKSFTAPEIQLAFDNVYKYPTAPSKTILSSKSIKFLSTAESHDDHPTLNTIGDTIQTGVAFDVRGKIVPANIKKPTQALAPRYRDEAQLDIKYLNVDQGLIYSGLVSSMQDSKNNIWCGTYGLGATKYDGQFFTSFSTEEGMSGDAIFAMEEDQHGNIWFGTLENGVTVYNGSEFIHYTEGQGLPFNRVWSIKEDFEGNIWIGTNKGGVTKFEPSQDCKSGKFTVYSKKEGLSGRDVRSIDIDSKGHLWLATLGGGVSEFIPGKNGEDKFRRITADNGLSSNLTLSILVDNEDKVWVGTLGSGITVIAPPTEEKNGWLSYFTTENGLSGGNITVITDDLFGKVWVGTLGNGVTMFDNFNLERLDYSNTISQTEGLTSPVIYGLTAGNEGNIWISTQGGGLNIYNPNSFNSFGDEKITNSNYVYAIHEGRDGKIWFGSRDGALSFYDDTKANADPIIGNYELDSGLPTNDIISIHESADNKLWLTTDGGGVKIISFNDNLSGTYSELSTAQGLLNNYSWSAIEDKQHNMWIATYGGGICKLDLSLNVMSRYTVDEGLPSNYVNCLLQDSKENIWFGTNNGLCKLEQLDGEEKITIYTEAEGLSYNNVVNLYQDENSYLWIGTGNCLNMMYEENGESKLSYFSNKNGITGNGIASIDSDKNGNIWIGTEAGVSVLWHDTTDIFYQNASITNLGRLDGLKGLNVLNGAGINDSKNRMWWGNGVGVSSLDLNSFKTSKQHPKVSINYIEINEKYHNFNLQNDSLPFAFSPSTGHNNLPKELKLAYDQNHLTFYFNAIDWNAPHKIEYSYRMLPISEKWSASGSENKADYRNLNYGNYTFELRAKGESGEWSKTEIFEFTIYPPWWHTWGARITYILTLLLIFYGILKYRTQALKKRQDELETEVSIATEEIVLQKNEIELAHEQLEEHHKEISDSITYAKRLQQAILPSEETIHKTLKDAFVLFRPKSVVSGDFYWIGKLNVENTEKVYVAAADCTGHGVPGAMVSVVCSNALEKTVHEKQISNTGKILDDVRDEVISKFEQSGEEVKDGMDVALCCYDFKNNKLQYSGANNPIWIVRKRDGAENLNEKSIFNDDFFLLEIKATKQPVGQYHKKEPFSVVDIQLKKNDIVYAFSDGIADQFGGDKGKKFKYKPLKELLLNCCSLPMNEQKNIILAEFEKWKGEYEQVDDVCMIGVKVH